MNNKPLSIFLADDDEADRMLFREAFDEITLNTIVKTFKNGVDLMTQLNSIDLSLPHLIFLDLNMPRKNGMECLKEIRSSERLKSLSVAIFSTSDSENDIEETFLAGANIYIHKPIDFYVLKASLEKALMTANGYQDKSMNRDLFLCRI